jgi:hypothetical protein
MAAPEALESGSAAVMSRVGSLPQVRLVRSSEAVTAVVFHVKVIARINHGRQVADVALAEARVDEVLADHNDVERGPLGVAVGLSSASAVRTAVALIRESRDQVLYGWQALVSSP